MNLDFMKDRPTLAERAFKPGTLMKSSLTKRVDQNAKDDRADKAAEGRWKREIWKLDKHVCRCCGIHVEKSLDLMPNRGECHHLAGRADQAVRWDVRNGALCCNRCHEKIEHNEIVVVQALRWMFRIAGKSYLNGRKKLTFKEAA